MRIEYAVFVEKTHYFSNCIIHLKNNSSSNPLLKYKKVVHKNEL